MVWLPVPAETTESILSIVSATVLSLSGSRFLLLRPGQAQSEHPPHQFFPMERNQRINITGIRHSPVARDAYNAQQDCPNISPQAEQCRGYQIDYPHKFKGITQVMAN